MGLGILEQDLAELEILGQNLGELHVEGVLLLLLELLLGVGVKEVWVG